MLTGCQHRLESPYAIDRLPKLHVLSIEWHLHQVHSLSSVPGLLAACRTRQGLGNGLWGTPGSGNAITDVEGVWVGHCTFVSEEGKGDHGPVDVRTGVTAILPRGATYGPVWAACEKLNGNGEMTGTTWIDESGFLEEPVLLTNTHSVGAVYEASIQWRRQRGYHPQDAGQGWASLPVVAETWDGRLNDIHGHHIRAQHVFAALDQAHAGRVEEGNVGGGTGMVCHGFKGGIGTASRLLPGGDTLGVLVQTNYGRREDLQITGVPVGSRIRGYEMSIQQPSPYQEIRSSS